MRILVVGNGAREDALSWRLSASPSCESLFHAPGNAGTASRGENWPINATDGKSLVERAKRERIDLAVLGPETSIAAGVADRLRDAGIATFGPSRSSGRLESSKVFSKRFMERHGIPTAKARIVRSFDAARAAIEDWEGPCVIKADGLAAGKGVVVAPDPRSAAAVINDWYAHNRIPGGGSDLVLEERLVGRELSVCALCDGRAMVPFAAACDYKRAGDGDTGPNTGGMGAYSPPAGFPPDYLDVARTPGRGRDLHRRFVLRPDVDDGRAVRDRVQRSFRRSGGAGPDAAGARRLRSPSRDGGRRCPRTRCDHDVERGVRRDHARDERLSADQHAVTRASRSFRPTRRRDGLLGHVDAERREGRCRRRPRVDGDRDGSDDRGGASTGLRSGHPHRLANSLFRTDLPQRHRSRLGLTLHRSVGFLGRLVLGERPLAPARRSVATVCCPHGRSR